jgi:hypothetical protein
LHRQGDCFAFDLVNSAYFYLPFAVNFRILKKNPAAMSFNKKAELNILINLAASDSKIEDKEAKLIQMIGHANGFNKDEVTLMIQNPQPIAESLSGMTSDEKFEHLYNLIQMMKMDGQVFRSEIIFCENVAEKLGYRKGIVGELSAYIYSDPSITSDRQMLRKKAEKFIRE